MLERSLPAAHWLLNSRACQLAIGQLASLLLMLAGCRVLCLTVLLHCRHLELRFMFRRGRCHAALLVLFGSLHVPSSSHHLVSKFPSLLPFFCLYGCPYQQHLCIRWQKQGGGGDAPITPPKFSPLPFITLLLSFIALSRYSFSPTLHSLSDLFNSSPPSC